MVEKNKRVVKESPTSETSNAVPGVAAGDLFDQISQGLIWLNERAWPLSGCVLFISILYLVGFVVEEKVPLSIASSSIIATLPVLFVIILLFIMLLVGLLLSPTAMLFTVVRKPGKERLVDLLVKPGNGRGRLFISKYIVIGWFLIPAIAVLFIGIVWLLSEKLNGVPGWAMSALVLLSLPISIVVFVLWFIREKSLKLKLGDISFDFWMTACVSVLPQFLIITYVFILSIRVAQSSGDSYSLLWGSVFIGVVILCFFQLIGAKLIASVTQPEKSLATSLKAGVIIVFLLGLYPSTASLLTGGAFQLTGSGGRACAVLTWNSDNPSGIEELHGEPEKTSDTKASLANNLRQSKKLRILIQVDEYYFVRPFVDKSKAVEKDKAITKVHFIPRDIVSSIDDCRP